MTHPVATALARGVRAEPQLAALAAPLAIAKKLARRDSEASIPISSA